MRLYVRRRISGRWHALVSYRGRVIETYDFRRSDAIRKAAAIALLKALYR